MRFMDIQGHAVISPFEYPVVCGVSAESPEVCTGTRGNRATNSAQARRLPNDRPSVRSLARSFVHSFFYPPFPRAAVKSNLSFRSEVPLQGSRSSHIDLGEWLINVATVLVGASRDDADYDARMLIREIKKKTL